MINRILIGLAGTPYKSVAIERTIKLVKHFDAEITGVTVVTFDKIAKVGLMPKGVLHAAREAAKEHVRITQEAFEDAIGRVKTACC